MNLFLETKVNLHDLRQSYFSILNQPISFHKINIPTNLYYKAKSNYNDVNNEQKIWFRLQYILTVVSF